MQKSKWSSGENPWQLQVEGRSTQTLSSIWSQISSYGSFTQKSTSSRNSYQASPEEDWTLTYFVKTFVSCQIETYFGGYRFCFYSSLQRKLPSLCLCRFLWLFWRPSSPFLLSAVLFGVGCPFFTSIGCLISRLRSTVILEAYP